MLVERVAARFGLGRPLRDAVPVPGGLSNELRRLDTEQGAFAVKRMVLNAGQPSFVENVEAAFLVERRAWAAGVAMPEPILEPSSGRALARIDGALVRVHRWIEGRAHGGSLVEVAGLLATVHAAGDARWASMSAPSWRADHWGGGLVELARRVEGTPKRFLVVDSHRDLDRKNTLRGYDGVLRAVDWDAAGPVGAVHEAVSDVWVSGMAIPPQPWVLAWWVAAQGEWLDYNATHRGDTALGAAEVEVTRARLNRFAEGMDGLLAAFSRTT